MKKTFIIFFLHSVLILLQSFQKGKNVHFFFFITINDCPKQVCDLPGPTGWTNSWYTVLGRSVKCILHTTHTTHSMTDKNQRNQAVENNPFSINRFSGGWIVGTLCFYSRIQVTNTLLVVSKHFSIVCSEDAFVYTTWF